MGGKGGRRCGGEKEKEGVVELLKHEVIAHIIQKVIS
jgi:hypothetical protein